MTVILAQGFSVCEGHGPPTRPGVSFKMMLSAPSATCLAPAQPTTCDLRPAGTAITASVAASVCPARRGSDPYIHALILSGISKCIKHRTPGRAERVSGKVPQQMAHKWTIIQDTRPRQGRQFRMMVSLASWHSRMQRHACNRCQTGRNAHMAWTTGYGHQHADEPKKFGVVDGRLLQQRNTARHAMP